MHFDQNPYPDDVQIDYIGILVGASSEFVSNWFENQRNEEEMCRQKENSISLKEEYEKRLNLHESFIDEKTSDAPPLFSPIAPPTTSSESNKLRRKLRESEQTCDSLLQTISEQSKQIEELKKGAESSKKSIIQEEEEQNLAMLAKDRKIRDLELKIGILEYSKEAGEREIQKLQNVLDSETSENAEKSKLDLKNAKIRALTHYIESDLKFQLKEKDQELAENYRLQIDDKKVGIQNFGAPKRAR
ncbi:hypothetical protein L3Y34_005441 [Caenorhabditis briggsae]|uniref:Homeobox domain-containing protein n=1 Tax=Caenorhabditis briggsae TaxID=6238 RepID=A0AAE9AJG4_CAEBR|nr:hypothetical protein L3Y34_005441 [Caenorhabditis briggsae]